MQDQLRYQHKRTEVLKDMPLIHFQTRDQDEALYMTQFVCTSVQISCVVTFISATNQICLSIFLWEAKTQAFQQGTQIKRQIWLIPPQTHDIHCYQTGNDSDLTEDSGLRDPSQKLTEDYSYLQKNVFCFLLHATTRASVCGITCTTNVRAQACSTSRTAVDAVTSAQVNAAQSLFFGSQSTVSDSNLLK